MKQNDSWPRMIPLAALGLTVSVANPIPDAGLLRDHSVPFTARLDVLRHSTTGISTTSKPAAKSGTLIVTDFGDQAFNQFNQNKGTPG